MTLAAFAAQDMEAAKNEYAVKVAAHNATYFSRIESIEAVPIIKNVYKEYSNFPDTPKKPLDTTDIKNGSAAVKAKRDANNKSASEAGNLSKIKREQKDNKVCPLYH